MCLRLSVSLVSASLPPLTTTGHFVRFPLYTLSMDTRKLDPINQLDRLADWLLPRLGLWWWRLEQRSTVFLYFRRSVGCLALAVFLAFTLWMIGGLLGVWPDEFAAYTWFAVKAWIGGAVACAFMLWGLSDLSA